MLPFSTFCSSHKTTSFILYSFVPATQFPFLPLSFSFFLFLQGKDSFHSRFSRIFLLSLFKLYPSKMLRISPFLSSIRSFPLQMEKVSNIFLSFFALFWSGNLKRHSYPNSALYFFDSSLLSSSSILIISSPPAVEKLQKRKCIKLINIFLFLTSFYFAMNVSKLPATKGRMYEWSTCVHLCDKSIDFHHPVFSEPFLSTTFEKKIHYSQKFVLFLHLSSLHSATLGCVNVWAVLAKVHTLETVVSCYERERENGKMSKV